VQKASIFRSVAALLFVGALAACGGEAETVAESESPIVALVAAAPAGAPGAVRASGMVGYRREPALSFNAPGVVIALDVDTGDVVRRGQRLAVLRRTSVGANPHEAQIARENAERDLARTQELFERGFVSEARLETARLAVERARETSVLTAPTDGVILARAAEPSQSVAAGAPVLVFGETNSGLVVRASVSTTDAVRIRIGDTVQVRVANAARPGRVTRVGAQGDARTGAVEVEVELATGEGVRSGMVAEVEIAAAGAENASSALVVPTLALLDARADQGIVFVVDAENVARRRTVRTAGVTQNGVLIVEGLAPGERVIAAGAAYVRDGERVRVATGA